MKEPMKILLAYDGSDCARAALDDLKTAGLPEQAHAIVMTLADVFLPPPIDEKIDNTFPLYVPEGIKLAHARAKHALDEAEELAKSASKTVAAMFPDWRVDYSAEADSPAWALIKKADDWQPDLVVLGARGHSVLGGRLILGSVSQRVLYEAPCSVRIGRDAYKIPDRPVRLLVGVDNSADSNAAIEAICERNWPKGAEIGLLAIVDTVMAVSNASDPANVKWIEVAEEKNWQQVRQLFEPAAEKLRKQGLHVEILVRRGNAADQVLQEAHTWGADCIFVGARGTRGIERLLLGSVSSAVAARAHCSVEVVRPKRLKQPNS